MSRLIPREYMLKLPLASGQGRDHVEVKIVHHRENHQTQREVLTGEMTYYNGSWFLLRNRLVVNGVLVIHTNAVPAHHVRETNEDDTIKPTSRYASSVLQVLYLFGIITSTQMRKTVNHLATLVNDAAEAEAKAQALKAVKEALFNGSVTPTELRREAEAHVRRKNLAEKAEAAAATPQGCADDNWV